MIDANGRPDGYTTVNGVYDKTDGVAESAGVSYRGTNGTLCRVDGLGGLEKGDNILSLYTKGSGQISVVITFHTATGDNSTTMLFPTSASWVRHDTTVVVPNDASTCDVEIQANQVKSTAARVSGIFLMKSASARQPGDVDGDGTVSSANAWMVLRHVSGSVIVTDPESLWAADVSGNGVTNAYDAALILRRAAGLK